ncbi:hypothetical protein, partial [Mesorhizobium sp. M1E.F.Ca.ET.041.01.1.1]|uniref:hypothetical protein n=1 Tax=Mesorhizobium sp. M1E.F.Ca.ET.041.01.1.1 TaxID=2496759 RepID=UPI001AECA60C
PPMFEEVLIETLAEVGRVTEPLRQRLRQQVETGRIFPEYPRKALAPAWEMYTRVTGNALFSDGRITKIRPPAPSSKPWIRPRRIRRRIRARAPSPPAGF